MPVVIDGVTYEVKALGFTKQNENGGNSIITADAGRFEVTVVPEPATVMAGALLLLPFAVSTLRLRRNRRNS